MISKFLSDQSKEIRKSAMKTYNQKNHTRKNSLRWISALLFFIPILAIMTQASTAETIMKKAALMPLWTPQAQFAGYYVALDKGIYARHGIELEILNAGPGHDPAKALKDGSADFAVLWLTTAIQQRYAGTDLVNLAQIIQRSSIMLISRKSSGIQTIADMNGKKVGMWGGDLSIPPHALFIKYGIKVREIPQNATVNLFLRGGIDVASAMWYNEYHTIINSGLDPEELNVFSLNELGMNFPEDGIYAMEKTLHNDPALAGAFVKASMAGWRYAFEHPEEALDIVIRRMREAKVPANRVHQKWMLNRMRDLIMPGTAASGILKENDYEAVCSSLRQAGLIRGCPDYTDFFWRSDAGEK
jgi:NitT/TauT family transport system substrate-binding protein